MGASQSLPDGPSLGDMPAEIVDAIALHLARARDAASCYVALGQSPTRALTKRALADPVAFLAAGAPLDIARALLDCPHPAVPVPFDWIEAAVYGGRLDVITTVWTQAGVDTAADLGRVGWEQVGRGRWRRLFGQARCLLEAAVCGRGGADIVRHVLDVYDAPRFDKRPLLNEGLFACLCRRAIKYGPDAVAVLTALHERRAEGRCACTAKVACTAARTNRADVLAWMCDSGCAARPRLDDRNQATALAVTAANARAPSVVAWVGARADRDHVLQAIFGMDTAPEEDLGIIMRGGLVGTFLVVLVSALVSFAVDLAIELATGSWWPFLLGIVVAKILTAMTAAMGYGAATTATAN
ncbi:hypothetical protein pdul_cds_796 [Pandoravirus dulcis]|uniref:Uncharacterized protein n=1 Tax=Pandoravirus dulcis TaxID=1349409 RepID=S4VYQ6_9VIRU|nr:hypothetical protein pdul_cds_796 [Pandoravirus dulcis]AGO82994.1 hypothetical protein pdul_cds_796 [Pandoravirus dulcis]